jgi:hypothetical protein
MDRGIYRSLLMWLLVGLTSASFAESTGTENREYDWQAEQEYVQHREERFAEDVDGPASEEELAAYQRSVAEREQEASFTDEHWNLKSVYNFSIIKSLSRSQGVANDGKGRFWYSSRSTLLRTDGLHNAAKKWRLFPLPKDLKKLKDNHIGDLDYFDGKLYIAAEDGPKYKHPFVVIYDPQTLQPLNSFSLPRDQQIDGVPWVTVDGPAEVAYSAQYYKTTKINVYDLDTFKPLRQISMSQTVDAIQGAKVMNGNMYMTANDETGKGHALFKLNLATGQVSQIALLPAGLFEIEGLTLMMEQNHIVAQVLAVVPFKGVKTGFAPLLRRMAIFSYIEP